MSILYRNAKKAKKKARIVLKTKTSSGCGTLIANDLLTVLQPSHTTTESFVDFYDVCKHNESAFSANRTIYLLSQYGANKQFSTHITCAMLIVEIFVKVWE